MRIAARSILPRRRRSRCTRSRPAPSATPSSPCPITCCRAIAKGAAVPVEQRLKELRDAIRHHEERYYIHNDPQISDAEFDALLHTLEQLEAEHPDLVTPDSPTQRVAGRPIEGFEQVDHLVPMLSLDNAYNEEELRAFDERVRKGAGLDAVAYVAELKIDGLSIALTYEKRRLQRGATRGSGSRGEDVTANVRTIRAIPLSLRGGPDDRVEIRGEVYLPRAAFEKLNREMEDAGEPLFANARNTAAGTMRNLDPALVSKRNMGAFVYQLVRDPAPQASRPADAGSPEGLRYESPGSPEGLRYELPGSPEGLRYESPGSPEGLRYETHSATLEAM